ncbi:hypothetical protein [Capybara microvirus Cap3_SP_554]|nr:hypothetical protein [Capybara microvirus Cap3_SP_554]
MVDVAEQIVNTTECPDMTKCILCAIFDDVSNIYSNIIMFNSDKEAVRYFQMTVCTNAFKNDYTLFKIGDYDLKTSKIESCKVLLAKGRDFTDYWIKVNDYDKFVEMQNALKEGDSIE